jgi:hypothetical protein
LQPLGGKVGIGTNTPNAMLEVNGETHINGRIEGEEDLLITGDIEGDEDLIITGYGYIKGDYLQVGLEGAMLANYDYLEGGVTGLYEAHTETGIATYSDDEVYKYANNAFIIDSYGFAALGSNIDPGYKLTIGGGDLQVDGGALFGGYVGIGVIPGTELDVDGTISQSAVVSCSLGLTTDAYGSINGCVASDEILKTNITDMNETDYLSILNALNPVHYQWNDTYKRDNLTHAGFIAQDVEAIYPEAISSAGTIPNYEMQYVFDEELNTTVEKKVLVNTTMIKGVDANAMVALLTKGIQEQQVQISNQQAEIGALQTKNTELENKTNDLENRLQILEAKVG